MLLLLAGIALLLLVLLDALWTTLAPHGAGPVTKGLARGLWSLALAVHRAAGGTHRLLAVVGPALLFLAFLWWVAGLWTGWVLVFESADGSVARAQTGEPADLASTVYFVGFTLFTMGNGDYVPTTDGWEIATAVAALSGLFVVTLAITYLVPVVSAVAAKRKLAAHLDDLGRSPVEIVLTAWDGSGFSSFEQHLGQIIPELEMHTQRHLAYPVVHYFHSTERRTAAGPAIVAFAEALGLLSHAVAPDVRPAPAVLVPAHRAVEGYLGTLRRGFVTAAADPLPHPSLQDLADAGIPVVDAGEFDQAQRADAQEGRLLHALVRDTGWDWSVVS
ncbi:MAG: potassium channel family protein [Rhodothermales bacterium]